MDYNTRNYRVFGRCLSSENKNENTVFWKLDLFPSSDEVGDTPLLGFLESANLNPQIECLPSPENRNRSSFRNVLFSSCLECRAMDSVQKSRNSER
jgi:hypothetical protein